MGAELQEILGANTAHTGDYCGVQTALDFGDVRAEYDALRRGAGVYALDWRVKIGLTGGDRVRWLNGMITNNVRDLALGHGVYAFLLNPQGRILADMNAYNNGEQLIVDTDRSQREKVVGTFDHFIIMDDVEVLDLSATYAALGIAGPQAQEALGKVGLDVPELQPLQFVDLAWRGGTLRLVRDGDVRRQAYELWTEPGSEGELWRALIEAGARAVGSTALEMNRIARGIPRYGIDLRERDLPQETGQERALNFNKGCYVGQEIVERIRSRGSVHRVFAGFRVHGPTPEPGFKIEANGKEVGEVTSAAALPFGEGEVTVALGYMRREAMAAQREVHVSGVAATVSELPFSDLLGK